MDDRGGSGGVIPRVTVPGRRGSERDVAVEGESEPDRPQPRTLADFPRLEGAKNGCSPLQPPEGMQPLLSVQLDPLQSTGILNTERVQLYGFKPLNLWAFVTAARTTSTN